MKRKVSALPPPILFRTSSFLCEDTGGKNSLVVFWVYKKEHDADTGGINRHSMSFKPDGTPQTGFATETHILNKRWTEAEAYAELCMLEEKYAENNVKIPDNDDLMKPYLAFSPFYKAQTLDAAGEDMRKKDVKNIVRAAMSTSRPLRVNRMKPKK